MGFQQSIGRRMRSLTPSPATVQLADNFGSARHLPELDSEALCGQNATFCAGAHRTEEDHSASARAPVRRELRQGAAVGRHVWRVADGGDVQIGGGLSPLRGALSYGVHASDSPARDAVRARRQADEKARAKAAQVAAQVAQAERLADVLAERFCRPGQVIFDTLRRAHASQEKVHEEVGLALQALRGLGVLREHLGERVGMVAATLPTTFSFYWLVAWGLVPAAQADEVMLWVPAGIHDDFRVLVKALQRAVYWAAGHAASGSAQALAHADALPREEAMCRLEGAQAKPGRMMAERETVLSIDLPHFGSLRWSPGCSAPLEDTPLPPHAGADDAFLRHEFFKQIGDRVNVVLFDDAPEAAIKMGTFCDVDCVFILQDAGYNPIVLGNVPAAKIAHVVPRLVAARIGPFMGEKAGTDAIFVPRHLKELVADALCLHLENSDGLRRVKAHDAGAMKAAMAFSATRPSKWSNLPVFDFPAKQMSPLVTLSTIVEAAPIAFSSPVFNLISYGSPADLPRYFLSPAYRHKQMWASIIGPSAALQRVMPSAGMLLDETVAEHQSAARAPAFHGQAGTATVRRGLLHRRPVCVAKELKTYALCCQTADAAQRQTSVVHALRKTFGLAMANLETELAHNLWQVAVAMYTGESAQHNFVPGTPIRCMLVVEPRRGYARLSGDSPDVRELHHGATREGATFFYGDVAARMASGAQLPASPEHTTVLTSRQEIEHLLAEPPPLFAEDTLSLTLGARGRRALLSVEALADPSQALWRLSCGEVAAELRGRARAVYSDWQRQFWAAVRAEGSSLPSLLGSALLTSLEAQPLVLSNILRAEGAACGCEMTQRAVR